MSSPASRREVTVDLSTQKANFQADLRVLAYDSKGVRLNDVGIDHNNVSVSIAISADVTQRLVAIIPRTEGVASPGHYLAGISVSPLTIERHGPAGPAQRTRLSDDHSRSS